MARGDHTFQRGIAREQLERAARIYHSNGEASRALGIAERSLSRLCRQHQIETPYARRLRRLCEARGGAPEREPTETQR